MISITAGVVFVLASIWNIFVLFALVDSLNKRTKLYMNDHIMIFVSLAIWFVTGVYLFGL